MVEGPVAAEDLAAATAGGTEETVDDWLLEAELSNVQQELENSDLRHLIDKAKKVAQIAAQATSKWVVVVEKPTPQTSLGVDIEKRSTSLLIKGVRPGPLKEYNAAADLHRAIRPGDRIIAVNGQGGTSPDLCAAITGAEGRVELTIQRAMEDEQARRKRKEARAVLRAERGDLTQEVVAQMSRPQRELPKPEKDYERYLRPPAPPGRPHRSSKGRVSRSASHRSRNASKESSRAYSASADGSAGGSGSAAAGGSDAAPAASAADRAFSEKSMKLAAMAPTAAAVSAAIMHPKFAELRQGTDENDLLKLAQEVRNAVEESLGEPAAEQATRDPRAAQDHESVKILAESVALALTADGEEEPAGLLSDLILAEAMMRRRSKSKGEGEGRSYSMPSMASDGHGQLNPVPEEVDPVPQQLIPVPEDLEPEDCQDAPAATFSKSAYVDPLARQSELDVGVLTAILENTQTDAPEATQLTPFAGAATAADTCATIMSMDEVDVERLETLMVEWLNVHCADALEDGSNPSDTPEIDWLAKCMTHLRLNEDQPAEGDLGFANVQEVNESASMPLFLRFAHMGRLALVAKQKPNKAKAAGARLAKIRDEAVAEAFRLQDQWAGPFVEEETGMEYYHNYETGESTWTLPAQAPLYLSWIADRLLRGGLFPEAAISKAGTLRDAAKSLDTLGSTALLTSETPWVSHEVAKLGETGFSQMGETGMTRLPVMGETGMTRMAETGMTRMGETGFSAAPQEFGFPRLADASAPSPTSRQQMNDTGFSGWTAPSSKMASTGFSYSTTRS